MIGSGKVPTDFQMCGFAGKWRSQGENHFLVIHSENSVASVRIHDGRVLLVRKSRTCHQIKIKTNKDSKNQPRVPTEFRKCGPRYPAFRKEDSSLISIITQIQNISNQQLERSGGTMARINIEDDLFKDHRWMELCIKVGSFETALGSLVRLWLVAQKYWKRDQARIPKAVWEEQKLNSALVETGWAVWQETSNGFFAEGSEKQFAWLVQRQEAGSKGGEASGETRKRDFNNLERSGSQRSEAGASGAKPPTLSPSLSLTLLSSSDSSSCSENLNTSPRQAKKRAAQASKLAVRGVVPEFSQDERVVASFSQVTDKLQYAWLKAYPSADWIGTEVSRAEAWIAANPAKAPKDFGRFMNNWLSNAFEKYRKGLPTNHQTASQKNADALRDMHERVLKGEL